MTDDFHRAQLLQYMILAEWPSWKEPSFPRDRRARMARLATASSTTREQQLQEMRDRVSALGESRDMEALAQVAEMSLRELRLLCERPVTCSGLGEMLDRLERLSLEGWDMGED